MASEVWPALPYPPWRDCCQTLHRWLQIAGKVRLALSPMLNHYWQATFYLTPRGLTSGPIPMPGGDGIFAFNFDFLTHQLEIPTSHGNVRTVPLRPCVLVAFEQDVLNALRRLGIEVKIWPMPVEVPNPVRFDQDQDHHSYEPDAVGRWWRILVESSRVMEAFRAEFIGKCSPVHLFWGSMDLAVTRFSGRRAPERPGADAVMREAYSHEVISAGFWAGDDRFPEPAYYAYAVPEPAEFRDARLQPAAAFYHKDMGEFMLRYEDVRGSANPAAALRAFLDSSYNSAADLGHWDRKALERQP